MTTTIVSMGISGPSGASRASVSPGKLPAENAHAARLELASSSLSAERGPRSTLSKSSGAAAPDEHAVDAAVPRSRADKIARDML